MNARGKFQGLVKVGVVVSVDDAVHNLVMLCLLDGFFDYSQCVGSAAVNKFDIGLGPEVTRSKLEVGLGGLFIFTEN